MRFIGLLGLLFLCFATTAHAQASAKFEIHGLRPGMIAREIVLHSHAPIDTMLWGGEDGANILAFKGEYLNDTGEFRVGTEGVNVSQVSFISRQRKPEANEKAVQRAIAAITKLYGPLSQDYTNVYHIVQWNSGGFQLTLTTMEHGQFYSIALSKIQPLSTPGPDPEIPGKPVLKSR
jgi:hypothetical protein